MLENIKNFMKVAGKTAAKTIECASENTKAYAEMYKSEEKVKKLFTEIGELYYNSCNEPDEKFKELFEMVRSEKSNIDKCSKFIEGNKVRKESEEGSENGPNFKVSENVKADFYEFGDDEKED